MTNPDKKIIQVIPGRRGILISQFANTADGPLLVIVNDLIDKQTLWNEVAFFNPDLPLYDFLDWETLPYDPFSPHIDIISERLRLLALLPHLQKGIILVGTRTLMAPLPPPQFIKTHAFRIQLGDKLNLQTERTALIAAGYRQVDQVVTRGEYSIRGSIFDIFPMGAPTPYRIDLFADEVESIRDFDIDSQRSQQKFTAIELLPAHEFPFDKAAISSFIERFTAQFKSLPTTFSALKNGIPIQGLEYYLPLFFEQTASLFDYCSNKTTIIFDEQTESTWKQAQAEILIRFEEKRYDLERPPLPPHALFWQDNALFLRMKDFSRIELIPNSAKNYKTDSGLPLPPFETLKQNFPTQKVLFSAETPGRQQLLQEHLQRLNISAIRIANYQAFTQAPAGFYLTVSDISSGWIDPDTNITLIPEAVILGEKHPVRVKKRQEKEPSAFKGFDDLSELNIGDIVVHIEHGIGRYLGLSTLELTGQTPQEFLTLEYQKGDKLYVPVHHLHLISRYSIGELQNVALNQLGTDRWSKTREKAARRITDIAAELLELYATRMSTPGFAFQTPNEDYQEFVLKFPFDETEDQSRAIHDVITDMTRPNPMDRLLCGDVGFGKTEVAMRAAFLAVQNAKQVAVLVPTTLLAEQHFESFQNRFAEFPLSIAHFSRFTSAKDEKEILAKTAAGKIDILIGTHKLIRSELEFKDLGLIIIDEEHRFGVKDKERLRSFKAHVDTLAMTATPIPRTLNFSLSMLRDLSIIATPPAKRLSVKTFVKEKNNGLIKEAILREVLRGGQVYYLHNDVASIEERRNQLQALLPNIRIIIGHGQMRPRELEKVMADFYHNRAQVLVCSTIIETGIDIPNANTILIENADRFGLAQLHQLRGRVGRSHHQAYAYLLVPAFGALTPDARKRLEAIEKSTELGAGFTLASHDLEIRGAGEVLGQEQSGHMEEIGFSLYQELLGRAITQYKKGEKLDYQTLLLTDQSEVELNIPRLFPEDYISDVHTRLKLYQRLQKLDTYETLIDFKMEVLDRFGPLPEPALYLIESQRLKLTAKSISISKIEGNAAQIKFTLTNSLHFDPLKLIRLVQNHARELQLRGEKELILRREMKTGAERIAAVDWVLNELC